MEPAPTNPAKPPPPLPSGPGENVPAVFFDRDGVVNISPGEGFVTAWSAFRFTPGIMEVLAAVKSAGLPLVLVTNQRAVALGLLDETGLAEIHRRMQDDLRIHGADFDAIYCATGDRDDPRRKPSPAMPREAARDLGIDLAQSVLVGDDDRDMECARAAGIGRAIRFRGDKPARVRADATARDVAELAACLAPLLAIHRRRA